MRFCLLHFLGIWLVFFLFSVSGQPQDPSLAKIKALERMNSSYLHNTAPKSEDASEQYAELIQFVAELHDPRAVPALIGAIRSGGMATNGLAAIGDAALDPVISVTYEKDSVRVNAAVITLVKMLNPENFRQFKDQAVAKQKMKVAFDRLQTSSNRFVSKNAREGLDLLKGK